MGKLSAREKIARAPGPEVHNLDDAKAARLKGRTMLIPSPRQIEEAIGRIPEGSSKSMRDLRTEVARASGAEIACPMVSGIFWRLVAEAAEEDRAEGVERITPWWRVTKDGKPNPKLPGGEERHRALLSAEGVQI